MSAQTRAALEAVQAEVKTLDAELAQWLEVSPARHELEARLKVLEAQRAGAARRADEVRDESRAVRAELDVQHTEGIRSHWWQSALAVPAIIVGLIGAFRITAWALEHYSWPSLGDHYGLPVLLTPVAVNGARVGWALFWRSRKKRVAQ